MKNVDTPSDIADCIISMRTIFQKKFSGINVTLCDLILRGECRSVRRVLINKVNEILKYLCNINGFSFIFPDNGWIFANGSFECSLLYRDLLHLIEQGNVELAKSITLTIASRYNRINLSSAKSNTSYSNNTRQRVQSTMTFHRCLMSLNPFCLMFVNHVFTNENLLDYNIIKVITALSVPFGTFRGCKFKSWTSPNISGCERFYLGTT